MNDKKLEKYKRVLLGDEIEEYHKKHNNPLMHTFIEILEKNKMPVLKADFYAPEDKEFFDLVFWDGTYEENLEEEWRKADYLNNQFGLPKGVRNESNPYRDAPNVITFKEYFVDYLNDLLKYEHDKFTDNINNAIDIQDDKGIRNQSNRLNFLVEKAKTSYDAKHYPIILEYLLDMQNALHLKYPYLINATNIKVISYAEEIQPLSNKTNKAPIQKQNQLPKTNYSKLKWNGSLPQLENVFYNIYKKHTRKGEPLLKATEKQMKDFLINNFLDSDSKKFETKDLTKFENEKVGNSKPNSSISAQTKIQWKTDLIVLATVFVDLGQHKLGDQKILEFDKIELANLIAYNFFIQTENDIEPSSLNRYFNDKTAKKNRIDIKPYLFVE